MLAPLRLFFADLRRYTFATRRLSLFLIVGLVCQLGYWRLGSPGPTLLDGTTPGLGSALVNIGWALVWLLLIPAAVARFAGLSFKDLGVRLGDVRNGATVTLVASLIAVVALAFGAQDAALQATYPWAGDWPGRSLLHLLAWAGLYALYYVSFEFFYRGFMLRTLEPAWGLPAAVWTQTVASVLIHLGKPTAEVIAAIPAGLIFAVLALRGRSLLWPIILHLVIGLSTDIFVLAYRGELLP